MAFDPSKLGDQLIIVGQKQIETGTKLKNSAVKVRSVGNSLNNNGQVVQTIVSVRQGSNSIRSLLAPVVNALQFIVTTLNGIRIPTVNFSTRTITIVSIRFTFVSGISIGSATPFISIATRVNTVRTNISSIRETLQTVSESLNSLKTSMPEIQTNILSGADEMDLGGNNLKDAGTAMTTAGNILKGN